MCIQSYLETNNLAYSSYPFMPSNEIMLLLLQVDYEKVDQVAFINSILLHGESIT